MLNFKLLIFSKIKLLLKLVKIKMGGFVGNLTVNALYTT